jgi:hypothetical protein
VSRAVKTRATRFGNSRRPRPLGFQHHHTTVQIIDLQSGRTVIPAAPVAAEGKRNANHE